MGSVGWPLIGREAECAQVTARLAVGGGLLIVGEPGVGKTRLARVGLDAAARRGARTLWVAGAEGASGVPLAALAHLLPDADDKKTGPTGLIRHAVRALAASPPGSLVIGLDDAQLVDAASAAVLHHAVVSGNASMLATARRGEELPEPVSVLVRDGRLARLDLGPLADTDVEALLTEVLDGPVDGGTVALLCAASQGNPMLVRELVHGGREAGALIRRDGIWVWHGSFAAPRLRDLVEARLKRLSDWQRSAVEAIAIGEPLPLGVAEDVVGTATLEALDRRELLDFRVAQGALLRLRHPLYGEVLRATMSPLRRRVIQLGLAKAMVARGRISHGDILRLVAWRLDGQEPNDPAHLRIAAGRALGACDFELAERIARSGLDGAGDACRVVLGLALAGQGRIDDAHRVLASREEWEDAKRAGELVSRALDVFFYGSRTANAATAVRRMRQLIDGAREWPQGSEPLVEAAQAGVLLLAGSVTEARAAAESVLKNHGAPTVARLRSLLVAAPSAAIACRTADALAYAEQGLSILRHGDGGDSAPADALMELDTGPLFQATSSMAHRFAGRLGQARTIAENGYRQALDDHFPPGRGLFALALGQVAFADGQIGHAARWLREAVTLLRRPPALYLVWALGYLAQAGALQGDLPAAQAAIAEAMEHRSLDFHLFDCDIRRAEAWVAALQGETRQARRIALEAAAAAAGNGQFGFAAQAFHDAARLGAATAAVRHLEALHARTDGELVGAFARHARALAEGDPGQILSCADTFETLGWRLCAAEAAAVAFHLLDQARQVQRAATAAERARAMARSCGGVVTPALAGLGSVPMLSGREDQIAKLAASGLSNRAIAARLHISVRTVDNHLHHIYGKLGITGRTELSATLDL